MRVLVTRPEPEASRTAGALAGRGHEAVVAPLFAATPVAAEIDGPFAALAVTSPRTIAMMPAGRLDALVALPAFAVGDRTAEALAAAGFTDVRSAAGDLHALAALVNAAGLPRGARVLHPGGEERAGDLGSALAPAGLSVITAVVYRMAPVTEWPEAAAGTLADGTIDAVLHYSPRAVEVFCHLCLTLGGAAVARNLRHVCLSPAVAAMLEPLGPSCVITAQRPDETALLAAL